MFVLLCSLLLVLGSSAEQCPEQPEFNNNSCVKIGDNVYHNVTQKWKPRISDIEGWVIQILPITLTFVIAVLYLGISKPGFRKLVRGIKEEYQLKMLHIYF